MKEEDIRKRDTFDQYLKMVSQDVLNFFNKEHFKEVVCPACDSSQYKFQFEKIGFRYVQCKNCETLFVNPRPSIQDLNRFYSDSPSTHFWVNQFFLPVAKIRQEKIFKPRVEFIIKRFPEM